MISIVVLGYHSVEDIRRCVGSLLRTEAPADRWRVVVVDNDSRPETRELLASYGNRIDVVTQETNTGYAGGMNIGIRHALERGAEYVVLMNQDAEVEPDWLRHLVAAVESDPTIGAVQPRIMLGPSTQTSDLRPQTSDLINSIGNHIHVLGFGFAGGHRERWSDLRPQLRGYPYPEVTYPSGAAVMYRAKALHDIAFERDQQPLKIDAMRSAGPSSEPSRTRTYGEGAAQGSASPEGRGVREAGSARSQDSTTARDLQRLQFLDEDYFLYHEDLDIGVRLWLRGWRCVLAPQAVVVHHYEFSRSITKLYWMERNRILFLLQNFRIPTLLLLSPMLLASELGLLILAKRGGWLSQKLKAWRSLLTPSKWGTYLRHRREKQARRRHPDRMVLARFVTRFTNQEMPNPLVERYVDPCLTAWWRCVRPLIFW